MLNNVSIKKSYFIGSNDLTQLTLGLDRDSSLVANLYDERNDAVKELIRQLVLTAKMCTESKQPDPPFLMK